MVWLPDDVWLAQKAAKGKGGGKSQSWSSPWQPQFQKTWSPWGGKGGFGKGKGKGKGLRDFDVGCKVWVGGLAEETTWKELQEIGNDCGKTKWVEVFKGKGAGTGMIAYTTEDEVATAIGALKGKQIGENAIEVDVWVKAEKPPADAPPAVETL